MPNLIDQFHVGAAEYRAIVNGQQDARVVELCVVPLDTAREPVYIRFDDDTARQVASLLRGETPVQVARVIPGGNGAV